ncbi:MAG: hypothetical protein R3E94_05290 [Burkholderiaceae bacterium]
MLLGIMDFGRWLFLLNGANEATRLRARLGWCAASRRTARTAFARE